MSRSLTNLDTVETEIGAGASLSAVLPANGRTPLWIETPVALTGTVLTFVAVSSVADDLVLRDPNGLELTLTLGAAGSRHSLMTELAARLAGHRELKIRAGTAASPAVQAAARTLRVGLRNVI